MIETEFFLQNSVSFSHNSVECAVRSLQIALFKQVLICILGKGNFKHEKISLFNHDFGAAVHRVARPAGR